MGDAAGHLGSVWDVTTNVYLWTWAWTDRIFPSVVVTCSVMHLVQYSIQAFMILGALINQDYLEVILVKKNLNKWEKIFFFLKNM